MRYPPCHWIFDRRRTSSATGTDGRAIGSLVAPNLVQPSQSVSPTATTADADAPADEGDRRDVTLPRVKRKDPLSLRNRASFGASIRLSDQFDRRHRGCRFSPIGTIRRHKDPLSALIDPVEVRGEYFVVQIGDAVTVVVLVEQEPVIVGGAREHVHRSILAHS